MAGLQETTLFDAPIEAVYSVLSDYENYQDSLTDIIKSEIVSSKKGEIVARFELKIVKSFYYVLKLKQKKNKEISWTLVESDIMKSNDGSWTLKKKGEQTEAVYAIDITFGLFVPKMVINAVLKGNLPQLFADVEAAAQNL